MSMWNKCSCGYNCVDPNSSPDWCDGRKVKGRFGLAFISETPCCCPEPIGWQVEFCDTPSKVEQRCKEMVLWANCPPLPRCDPCPPTEVVSPCYPPKCNPCCPMANPYSACSCRSCEYCCRTRRKCCYPYAKGCYSKQNCGLQDEDDYQCKCSSSQRRRNRGGSRYKDLSADGKLYVDEIPVKDSSQLDLEDTIRQRNSESQPIGDDIAVTAEFFQELSPESLTEPKLEFSRSKDTSHRSEQTANDSIVASTSIDTDVKSDTKQHDDNNKSPTGTKKRTPQTKRKHRGKPANNFLQTQNLATSNDIDKSQLDNYKIKQSFRITDLDNQFYKFGEIVNTDAQSRNQKETEVEDHNLKGNDQTNGDHPSRISNEVRGRRIIDKSSGNESFQEDFILERAPPQQYYNSRPKIDYRQDKIGTSLGQKGRDQEDFSSWGSADKSKTAQEHQKREWLEDETDFTFESRRQLHSNIGGNKQSIVQESSLDDQKQLAKNQRASRSDSNENIYRHQPHYPAPYRRLSKVEEMEDRAYINGEPSFGRCNLDFKRFSENNGKTIFYPQDISSTNTRTSTSFEEREIFGKNTFNSDVGSRPEQQTGDEDVVSNEKNRTPIAGCDKTVLIAHVNSFGIRNCNTGGKPTMPSLPQRSSINHVRPGKCDPPSKEYKNKFHDHNVGQFGRNCKNNQKYFLGKNTRLDIKCGCRGNYSSCESEKCKNFNNYSSCINKTSQYEQNKKINTGAIAFAKDKYGKCKDFSRTTKNNFFRKYCALPLKEDYNYTPMYSPLCTTRYPEINGSMSENSESSFHRKSNEDRFAIAPSHPVKCKNASPKSLPCPKKFDKQFFKSNTCLPILAQGNRKMHNSSPQSVTFKDLEPGKSDSVLTYFRRNAMADSISSADDSIISYIEDTKPLMELNSRELRRGNDSNPKDFRASKTEAKSDQRKGRNETKAERSPRRELPAGKSTNVCLKSEPWSEKKIVVKDKGVVGQKTEIDQLVNANAFLADDEIRLIETKKKSPLALFKVFCRKWGELFKTTNESDTDTFSELPIIYVNGVPYAYPPQTKK